MQAYFIFCQQSSQYYHKTNQFINSSGSGFPSHILIQYYSLGVMSCNIIFNTTVMKAMKCSCIVLLLNSSLICMKTYSGLIAGIWVVYSYSYRLRAWLNYQSTMHIFLKQKADLDVIQGHPLHVTSFGINQALSCSCTGNVYSLLHVYKELLHAEWPVSMWHISCKILLLDGAAWSHTGLRGPQ